MESNLKPASDSDNAFNSTFNCDKMRALISSESKETFNEKIKKWLHAYTRSAREKIWVDIESYKSW